jgi:predicted nucleic acid-binding protein
VIVLDASVLIGHLDGNDVHHQRARELLEVSAASPLGASPISLAETLVAPARVGRLDAARAALARLGVAELRFSDDAAGRLATLRASTGRRLPDCCVLLAAQDHAATVATFDKDLARAARDLDLGVL